MLRGAGKGARAGENATRSGKGSESGRNCLVGENTNKGKCYAERDSERERVIPIVLLMKTPTRAETKFLSFRSFMSFKGRKGPSYRL